MFVSIDPGAMLGWAIWTTNGLVDCGLGDPRRSQYHIVSSDKRLDVINDVWIEWPVIYPRSKARPNDIMKLGRIAAEHGGIYKACGVAVHYIEPAEWKGQLSKEKHHPRVWAALRDFERPIVEAARSSMSATKFENVCDAVGLGQWARKQTAAR